ncbi:MAG: class I SAM-dependent methyltransferase [Fibrobacterota bacterium]
MSLKTIFKSRVPAILWNALRKAKSISMSSIYRVKLVRYRLFGRPYYAAESTKARPRRLREGYFHSYCSGKGLDIGYGGDIIVNGCQGWDYEHGDAQYLSGLRDTSFDFVYSSHTLEHMKEPGVALANWWRVLKVGGYLLLYLPHRDLYEKKVSLPSRWNHDHKHFFLLDRDEPPSTIGVLPLIHGTLTGYVVEYAKLCSAGHTITDPEIHSDGEFSIEVVIKKAT